MAWSFFCLFATKGLVWDSKLTDFDVFPLFPDVLDVGKEDGSTQVAHGGWLELVDGEVALVVFACVDEHDDEEDDEGKQADDERGQE